MVRAGSTVCAGRVTQNKIILKSDVQKHRAESQENRLQRQSRGRGWQVAKRVQLLWYVNAVPIV